jgi:hypothetical protein
MSLEEKLLNGLVQVYTRGITSNVLLRIYDETPIPPFDISVSRTEFLEFLGKSDLSTLTLKSLIDLSTLYFKDFKEVFERELSQRKSVDPDFSEKLSKEVMPRLRKADDPTWRFQ